MVLILTPNTINMLSVNQFKRLDGEFFSLLSMPGFKNSSHDLGGSTTQNNVQNLVISMLKW